MTIAVDGFEYETKQIIFVSFIRGLVTYICNNEPRNVLHVSVRPVALRKTSQWSCKADVAVLHSLELRNNWHRIKYMFSYWFCPKEYTQKVVVNFCLMLHMLLYIYRIKMCDVGDYIFFYTTISTQCTWNQCRTIQWLQGLIAMTS